MVQLRYQCGSGPLVRAVEWRASNRTCVLLLYVRTSTGMRSAQQALLIACHAEAMAFWTADGYVSDAHSPRNEWMKRIGTAPETFLLEAGSGCVRLSGLLDRPDRADTYT